MEYDIRLAIEKDLDGLYSVRNNLDLFNGYLHQHRKNEIQLVVAEYNSNIIGFGVLKLKGSLIPKLSDLYVKESDRGHGVGSSLIKYREKIARNIGYSEIYVSVDPIENPKMIKLIEKHGYSSISEPYLKTALFYNSDGTTYTKTYMRIDFIKFLSE